MPVVILAVLAALLLAVVSFIYQGAWFASSTLPDGGKTELRRSELRQQIADCREAVLNADPDAPPKNVERVRQTCGLLEAEYRRRFGEAP